MRPGRSNVLSLALATLTLLVAHAPVAIAEMHVHPVLVGKVRLPSAVAFQGLGILRRPKYNTTLTVANLSKSDAATVTVTYYKSGKSVANPPSASQDLGPGAIATYEARDQIRGRFLGSVVVRSDQPVAVVSQTHWRMGGTTYFGASSGSPRAAPAPSLRLGPISPGGTSLVCMQNTSGSAATVSTGYYNASGSWIGEHSENVPASGARCQAVPTGFSGSAVVSAGSYAPLSVSIVRTGQGSLASYPGWNYSSATGPVNTVYAPLVRKNGSSSYTGIQVQNVSKQETDITVSYVQSGGMAPPAVETAESVGPGQTASFKGGDLPEGFIGSATIKGGKKGDLVAVVSQVQAGDALHSYKAFAAGESVGKGQSAAILIPPAISSGWSTTPRIYMQNVGKGKARVDMTCGDGQAAFTRRSTIGKKSNAAVEVPTSGFQGAVVCVVDVGKGKIAAVASNTQLYLPVIVEASN